MPQTLAQKLKIKENQELFLVNAPADFAEKLGPLPAGVRLLSSGKKPDQVHWFVKNQAQIEKDVNRVISLLQEPTLLWIYFPKGSSGIQTDLTRDKGWDALSPYSLQFISLISFDNTWSAFAMRKGAAPAAKKTTLSRAEQFADYYNPKTKTVTLPDDIQKALAKNKHLQAYFDSLAFSHKREYIEWIVSAKKEETRANRITGMMERLEKGWKNPVGR